MLNFSAKLVVFVSLLFTFGQAQAGRVTTLYDVEIPVADESAGVRKQAFEQGLDEVFIRISGDSTVMDSLERPPASRYVKQFSYEPLAAMTQEDVTNKDAEVMTHRLKIQYNGSLMGKYLLDHGFATWGEYRPDVVIWMVVRDGRNEYVLKDSDASLLKTSAVEALTRRGIPGLWPLYDAEDRKVLNVADIRGGFKEPVARASRRYSRGPALTGSMIWNGRQWQSSWGLLVEGEIRHWNLDDVDHKQLINKAIDQAADMLGAAFAVRNVANKQQVVNIQLDVSAVNSIEKYRYVENYLAGLSAVKSVKPFSVDGQSAVFEIALRSNEEDFINLIRNDAELIEVKDQQLKPRMVSPPAAASALENDGEAVENRAFDKFSEEAVVKPAEIHQPLKHPSVYYYRLNRK